MRIGENFNQGISIISGSDSAPANFNAKTTGDIFVQTKSIALQASRATFDLSAANVTLSSKEAIGLQLSMSSTHGSISATENISIIGSSIGVQALDGDLNLTAGNDINISSTGDASSSSAISIDQESIVNFDAQGSIRIQAQNGKAIDMGNLQSNNRRALTLNATEGVYVVGDIAIGDWSDFALGENTDHLYLDGKFTSSDHDGTVVKILSDNTQHWTLAQLGSKEDKVIDIKNVDYGDTSDAPKFEISYTGEAGDKLFAGGDANDLFDGILIGDSNNDGESDVSIDSVSVAEGAWATGGVYTKDNTGNVTFAPYTEQNSLLTSATDLALMNGLVWRSQLTNLSDRMGTLRTMPQAAGAWARYNNGRLDGRGIEYDYNTIEVGFDAPVSSNFLVGVSFDYTIGDTDLNAGSADNDVYTLGLYGTYFGDNGSFVDLMAKIGRIDNEYTVANSTVTENGDYMMTGAIVGIEAGHRFDLAHNTFVEPLVQLSYSWLRASDYSTNVRDVDFDTVESLVARVGVMGGIKFNENRGAAYLKASYNHDFLGDVDAEYSAGSFSRKISDELDDNWAEVSLGFSYNVTDSFNTFLDVGTGFGGDIDQKWRVNFGGRYTF